MCLHGCHIKNKWMNCFMGIAAFVTVKLISRCAEQTVSTAHIQVVISHGACMPSSVIPF